MATCASCHKDIGIFSRTYTCLYCGKTLCKKCRKLLELGYEEGSIYQLLDLPNADIICKDNSASLRTRKDVACKTCYHIHFNQEKRRIAEALENAESIELLPATYKGRRNCVGSGIKIESFWHKDWAKCDEELQAQAYYLGCNCVMHIEKYKAEENEDNYTYSVWKKVGIAFKVMSSSSRREAMKSSGTPESNLFHTSQDSSEDPDKKSASTNRNLTNTKAFLIKPQRLAKIERQLRGEIPFGNVSARPYDFKIAAHFYNICQQTLKLLDLSSSSYSINEAIITIVEGFKDTYYHNFLGEESLFLLALATRDPYIFNQIPSYAPAISYMTGVEVLGKSYRKISLETAIVTILNNLGRLSQEGRDEYGHRTYEGINPVVLKSVQDYAKDYWKDDIDKCEWEIDTIINSFMSLPKNCSQKIINLFEIPGGASNYKLVKLLTGDDVCSVAEFKILCHNKQEEMKIEYTQDSVFSHGFSPCQIFKYKGAYFTFEQPSGKFVSAKTIDKNQ